MNISKEFIPFVEKYRPTDFDNIVLDPLNKKILKNIIETFYFPNLLFYGPPGTGKTTTIINLINTYQEKVNIKNKDLIIHLNASDERGIDIIRNQINCFVNSNTLFQTGTKFVILDEVDYMTKNAQQALRYLLQNYSNNVRFCLICNYISKIDEGLQNEFIRLHFNQLPDNDIIIFLKNISVQENLGLTDKALSSIQKIYKSDIRSMINFMQSNQDIINIQNNNGEFSIIDSYVWENLLNKLKNREKHDNLNNLIYSISIKYNIDKKNIIKDFLNYIIKKYIIGNENTNANHQNKANNKYYIHIKFLNFIENLLHSQVQNSNIYINYSLSQLSSLLSSTQFLL
jgi:replication factor C subunit 3/5